MHMHSLRQIDQYQCIAQFSCEVPEMGQTPGAAGALTFERAVDWLRFGYNADSRRFIRVNLS